MMRLADSLIGQSAANYLILKQEVEECCSLDVEETERGIKSLVS